MTARVGVTTAIESAGRWVERLRAAGCDPIVLPCIEVSPVGDDDLDLVRRAVAVADLVLLTSARPVSFLYPDGGMPPVPVAAVGPVTAAAVEAAGGVVEIMGEGDGDDLVDLVAPSVAGRRIVFPHSRSVDPDRIDRLRRAGAEMIAAVVYDTIPVPPGPDPVDAAIFASPSAVFGWLQSRTFSELSVVAALGPTTRAQLEGAGVADPVMGSRPTVPSLVDALVARLEVR